MKKLLAAATIGLCVLLLGVQRADSAATTSTVQIQDFAFTPATLNIHVGDTVVFSNGDDVTHNVSGDGLSSGDIAAGKSWTHTFDKAGTYAYVCTYHSGMKGTIAVTDASQ